MEGFWGPTQGDIYIIFVTNYLPITPVGDLHHHYLQVDSWFIKGLECTTVFSRGLNELAKK